MSTRPADQKNPPRRLPSEGPRGLRWLAMVRAFLLVLAATVVGLPNSAAADVFWDKPSVLKSFFAKSERVTFKKLQLSAAQVEAARKRLGYAPSADLTVYYGLTKDRVDGVAIIDDERGQHQPITFAVLIGPDGAMQRLEVMVYREAYGDEVREPRFRSQFKGKTASDPVKHGQDIVAVAGATISSKAMAAGARRALIVTDEALFKPGLQRTLAPAHVAATPAPPRAAN